MVNHTYISEDICNSIKVKKLDPEAVLPQRAKEGDVGYDLVAIDDGTLKYDDNESLVYIQYKTGLTIEPPKGYYVEIFPRSSITKTGLILGNSIGLVDEGYRGELLLRFKFPATIYKPISQVSPIGGYVVGSDTRYKKGDKIGQLVIRKAIHMNFKEVEELSDTDRSDGGFGSTG
jgi:dUTP pyrophosphatase